jgi:ABC-type branched-subunit amino acid transport system substrate-binding protein
MRLSRAVTAAVAAALLTVAGCGNQDGAETAVEADGVRLYGSDGNMLNTLGEAFQDRPGVLAGMKGTAPLTPLSDDFIRRLRALRPSLTDYNYAGESYDATNIAALATEIARTTEPKSIAKYVNGVTSAEAGDVECRSFPDCAALVRQGKGIQYRGISLRRGGFTDAGEPSTASYATLHFSNDNRLDAGKTEFVGAGNESDTTKAKPPAPPPLSRQPAGVPLVLASLLPKTGQLAGSYPPLVSGVQLAIKEINDSGGVLGAQVTYIEEDDGTSGDKAKGAVERLLRQDVHVIIGAGASGVSLAVLPRVVQAGVLMISPSATSDELTGAPDSNLFFRTAPPDTLQAKALADIVMRDGSRKVFIVAREDSWGKGLSSNLKANLEGSGIRPENVKLLMYKPGDSNEPDLGTIPEEIKNFAPDGLVILGFDESAHIIDVLVQTGIALHH